MKMPQTVRHHQVYITFGQRREVGHGVSAFSSENGYLQVVEEEQKKRGRTILAKHPPGQERGVDQRLFMSLVS